MRETDLLHVYRSSRPGAELQKQMGKSLGQKLEGDEDGRIEKEEDEENKKKKRNVLRGVPLPGLVCLASSIRHKLARESGHHPRKKSED